MSQKVRNIILILMVLILFMPSISKLTHHHKSFVYNKKTEKNIFVLQEKCAVCSFEFSFFLSEKINQDFAKVVFSDNNKSCFNIYHNSNLSKYSFLLRAPPEIISNI